MREKLRLFVPFGRQPDHVHPVHKNSLHYLGDVLCHLRPGNWFDYTGLLASKISPSDNYEQIIEGKLLQDL